MMKIFIIAEPSTIHWQTELCCRTLWQSFKRSFSLGDFEASAIENVAAVPNLDNITICSCGHCLQERGRYCPCKSANHFCSSACHEEDFGQCMNSRRVHEDPDTDDTDHTVRSFWDRFIDLYITMFLNFMEACKSVNNCMLHTLLLRNSKLSSSCPSWQTN